MYFFMKTVHVRIAGNRLIQGIVGFRLDYYEFPDNEDVELRNPVFSGV
jgi:hypothetical protein